MPVKVFGLMTVFHTLPSRINRLHELVYNVWWSWHPEACALYSSLDPDLWEQAGHNPVRFLIKARPQVFENAAKDAGYLQRYDSIFSKFDAYLHPRPGDTWFARTYPDLADHPIAYFSAEFGLHESLPIYSGGLGILSGDHAKEASDLGLPFAGVGFLYEEGYFHQRIMHEGKQEAYYDTLHMSQAPVLPVYNEQGAEVLIDVDLPGRRVYARIWKIQVGRIPLYLMDTDIPHNNFVDRKLPAPVHSGDQETRISQEILLGIGGGRPPRAPGLPPPPRHRNDGTTAVLTPQCLRRPAARRHTLLEAREGA